jgi:ketol-acid reductoisomerase
MNIYYDKDADLSIIQGLKVTIIGYDYRLWLAGPCTCQ